jgi:hypothetical protein
MHLTTRHKWLVVTKAASAVAAPLAQRAVAATWKGVAGGDPPDEVDDHDESFGRVLAWAAASALAMAVARVVARRGAGVVWQQVTGSRPPRPRRRVKRLARR